MYMNFFPKYISKAFLLLFLNATVLFFAACNDEIISTDTSKKLEFSTDTLTFDTVFTTFGSTTHKLLVYNNNSQALRISSIALSGGKDSPFRVNVDGMKSVDNSFTNIEIPGKDSIYIFVEVTIDPANQNSPLLMADSLIFTTNTNRQKVRFEAFGQDVVLFKNKLIVNDTTLTTDKPYLIYGYLAVDSAKTLNIPAGCKLYFHNNANLLVYGNLNVNGTFENPVTMQGDRNDAIKFDKPVPYKYVAGQWGGVYLLWKGGNHLIKHLNVTSGYVGLYFVNSDRSTLPNLEIQDSRIHNFVYYGIVAQNGNLKVTNSEITNTGSYTVYLNGGKHVFVQSTIANYMNASDGAPVSRDKNPAVMLMDLYRNAPMEAEFTNCIIMGSLENELSIATRFVDKFRANFTNCYIRKKTIADSTKFNNVRWYADKDTVFKYPDYDYKINKYFNFMPDSISPARGIAKKSVAEQFPIDLNGNNRLEDNEPDAGAYEWKPTVVK